MSLEYDEYLKEHIGNVKKAYEWMKQWMPEVVEEATADPDPEWSIDLHDGSKYSIAEYAAYDDYFYGGNKSYAVVQNFNKAWLHHIHNNPHHWQHWVLLEDDPVSGEPFLCIEMPHEYVIEMICDWWTFSWKKNDLTEVFKWYDDHKEVMKLHKNTRKLVEKILDKIREVLDMEPESGD